MVHTIEKRYPHRSGSPDDRHRAPAPASAALCIFPLTTVQLHHMSAVAPADSAESRLMTCQQRAAGSLEHRIHRSATRKKKLEKKRASWRVRSPPASDAHFHIHDEDACRRPRRCTWRGTGRGADVTACAGMQEQHGDDGARTVLWRQPSRKGGQTDRQILFFLG